MSGPRPQLGPTPAHGTNTRYRRGCRCEPCKAAAAEYSKARRARVRDTLAPDDPRHGTQSAYIHFSCRCDRCSGAKADYDRSLRERNRAAVPAVTRP